MKYFHGLVFVIGLLIFGVTHPAYAGYYENATANKQPLTKHHSLFTASDSPLTVFGSPSKPVMKDEWVSVKSKNFNLVGNASEKEVRLVATRLEQFREVFRIVFAKVNLTASISTNVVVFKDDKAYGPFKPRRADGKLDKFIAGFFQPGEDVNYITLSMGGEDAATFSTIFHEYVHFIVNTNFGKSSVPPWFNEGLAEFYSTFAIEGDQKVKLGLPDYEHVARLQQTKGIPLSELLAVTNYGLLQQPPDTRSVFYSQSWALVHYLVQSGKSDQLNKFLALMLKNSDQQTAFTAAFGVSYAEMEKELRKYVTRSSYQYQMVELKAKLVFDSEMVAAPLSATDASAYLGDLLYHVNRADEAEPFLVEALKVNSDSSMANTTLGMVKMKQAKYDEARTYLEKAVAGDAKNHLALYRYAFLLSREGRDEFGYVRAFDKDVAAKIRDAVKRAIAIAPAFTETYELAAFVNLVNNEQLDEAVAYMRTALKYQPGNQRYALRLAELLYRQNKLDDAAATAAGVASGTDAADIRQRANDLATQIAAKRQFDLERAAAIKRYGSDGQGNVTYGPPPALRRIEKEVPLTEAEIAKQQFEETNRNINVQLRKPMADEIRVEGKITKIDCKARPLVFTIVSDGKPITVTTKDFEGIELKTYDEKALDVQVGCDANVSKFNAFVTYRTSAVKKGVHAGELVAVEFVAPEFRLLSQAELDKPTVIIYDEAAPDPKQYEEARRAGMMQALANNLRTPKDAEVRIQGTLAAIECSSKAVIFVVSSSGSAIRLLSTSPNLPSIRSYTPDLADMNFDCTFKGSDFPAIVVYDPKPDGKAKTAGEIQSIDFVPKGFTLPQ